MPTLVVEVKGGLVQGVYSDAVPMRVMIVDYDNHPDGEVYVEKVAPIEERLAKKINLYDRRS